MVVSASYIWWIIYLVFFSRPSELHLESTLKKEWKINILTGIHTDPSQNCLLLFVSLPIHFRRATILAKNSWCPILQASSLLPLFQYHSLHFYTKIPLQRTSSLFLELILYKGYLTYSLRCYTSTYYCSVQHLGG